MGEISMFCLWSVNSHKYFKLTLKYFQFININWPFGNLSEHSVFDHGRLLVSAERGSPVNKTWNNAVLIFFASSLTQAGCAGYAGDTDKKK